MSKLGQKAGTSVEHKLYQPDGHSTTVRGLIQELDGAQAAGYTHVWMDGTSYAMGSAIETLEQRYYPEEPVGVVKQVSLPQREEYESD